MVLNGIPRPGTYLSKSQHLEVCEWVGGVCGECWGTHPVVCLDCFAPLRGHPSLEDHWLISWCTALPGGSCQHTSGRGVPGLHTLAHCPLYVYYSHDITSVPHPLPAHRPGIGPVAGHSSEAFWALTLHLLTCITKTEIPFNVLRKCTKQSTLKFQYYLRRIMLIDC